MKRMTPEELPKELDKHTINVLVEMCMESPKKTLHWAKISEVLAERGELEIILDAVDEKRRQQHKEWLLSLSEEEQAGEERKGKKMKENPDGFYGNMGNPEYPE